MKIALLVVLVLAVLCGIVLAGPIHTVDYQRGTFVLRQGSPSPISLAWGHFDDEITKDGWDKLYVNTNTAFTTHQHSLLMYYAAGYLEGALTWSQISDHYKSWYDYTFKRGTAPPIDATAKWVNDQDAYARQKVKENPDDEYYQALARVLAQFDGMFQAIQDLATSDKKLTKTEFLYLQGAGDMYEIIPAANPAVQVDWQNLMGEELHEERHRSISCSALIKATSDWSDVVAGHTTWTSYQNMLRVYKYYQFAGPKPYRVSFSAKPAMIYSKDDFYVLPDQNLIVMETTNGVLDKTLYQYVVPNTLLTWHRVPMANQLASNGADWTSLFIKDNSGTYNNQYMVIDLKTVENGQPSSGFLWISETMPGKAKRNDVTKTFIENGNYWPSYNVPFDKEIYDYGGYKAKADAGDDQLTYKGCVRSKLFAEQQAKVTDIVTLQTCLRYNDYKNDPLSQSRPEYAIANRSDLKAANPATFGAIDGKVTSRKLVKANQAWAQSGPTHDQQPVFKWADWPTGVRPGQPDVFNFGWVLMQEQ